MTNVTPDQTRRIARQARFFNSAEEAEVLARVDEEAFDTYRRHETLLNQETATRIEDGRSLMRVADELADRMVTDVRKPLGDGALPTPELAQQYERLRFDFQTAIDELEMQARRAETLAERLDDPAGDFERFAQRFPVLRNRL